MTSAPDTPPQHQIIVAACCYADATPAIAMAAGLAQWAGADLRGILVEQEMMATRRLVTPAGAQVAAPTLPQMRRHLASDARIFEAELAKLARNLQGWTFERMRGDLMARMRAMVQQGDILLIGHHGFYRHRGVVILIHSPGQAQHRAFDIAAKLARDQNVPLRIYAAAPDPEQRQAILGALDTMLARADIAGSSAHVFGSAGEILARINRTSAVAVIIDTGAGPFRSDADMGVLFDVARCPLVIAG